jgi:DNA-binding NarL/FixJ family response regulator
VSISVLPAGDQPLLRRRLRMIIEAEGDLAIDCARRNPPDIVLMDIRMPGTGGIEATRQISAAIRTAASGNTVISPGSPA